MAWGTWLAYGVASPTQAHFGGPLVLIPGAETTKIYIALLAFALNLVLAIVLTVALRATGVSAGTDHTAPDDYTADLDDEGVKAELDPEGALMWARTLLALTVLGLASAGPAAATSAPERAAGYTTYVACSNSKKAPASHSCGREEKKAAFFVSEDADVLYDICLKVPGSAQKICAYAQEARQGKTYRNTITSQKPGKHTVTWYVDGAKVDSFSVRVRDN